MSYETTNLLSKEKDGSIYQTARLRKNIKAAFEHMGVPYYEKNRGNIDIALFGSLRNKDIGQIIKCKKRIYLPSFLHFIKKVILLVS